MNPIPALAKIYSISGKHLLGALEDWIETVQALKKYGLELG